ncbi:TssQ family T6SS-associated lipoprotein [Massilia sp. DD77]|uniref:TssQ family T6SS-associated lipoprotein n=1 Tax=Massilia sp. DD77 TaxID=3109349 RepID=UPI002FFEBE11
MKYDHPGRLALAGLMALTLSACAQLEQLLDKPEPRRQPVRVEDKSRPRAERAERTEKVERPVRVDRQAPDRDDIALREGIHLYNEGEYNAAIKRLNSGDMNGASQRNRLAALKYTAFSYCVTGRQAQCRQSFERALKLDPGFDLGPGEHGHPLWGPVFAKAKQTSGR